MIVTPNARNPWSVCVQRSALGLALSMSKAALVLAPLAGRHVPQRRNFAAPAGRGKPPVEIELLSR